MTEITYVIIDISNMTYRSLWAHKELKTSKGAPSGHIYGVGQSILAMLRNELKDLSVKFCFCYDGINAKNRRREILPDYKGKRKPHDFDPMSEVKQFTYLWPGIHIEQEDMEGDDAIAFCVNMRKGKPCIVWSGDKDMWALTKNPNCKIFSPNVKRFIVAEDILENYSIDNAPERIYLAKSLFGDASDNIQGIDRLQKKQIVSVLNSENVITPEDFYNKLGSTRPAFITENSWKKLLNGKERVFKNFQVIQPQLDFKPESVKVVQLNKDLIKQSLINYECFSLLNQVDNNLY
jgi:DNA polymerase I